MQEIRTGAVFALGLLVASLVPVTSRPAQAAEAQNHTEYAVRYLGVPVARMSFLTRLDGSRYEISGDLKTAGIVEIIEKTRGTTAVSGTMAGNRLQASRYTVAYTSGKKSQRVDVTFKNGNVVSASQTPPPKKRGPDWVAVSRDDLLAVLDPVSGLIYPAGRKGCPARLPIFDGESRVDLELTDLGTRPFRTEGFEGEAVACTVRFVPKAGYRKGNDQIAYLRKVRGIEVWFARSPTVDVYAPVFARVPTKIGAVTVTATQFGR